MKRMILLAVVAASLVTSSNAHACGGCGGGFAWLGGGSCAPRRAVSRIDGATAAHLTVAPLATGYAEFNQAKWTLAAMGLQRGLVGLTSR